MAVPKKKMSKSRRNLRNGNWKRKVSKNIFIAISRGKSIMDLEKKGLMLDKNLDLSLINGYYRPEEEEKEEE